MKAAMERQRTTHVTMTTGVTDMRVHAEGDIAFRGARQDLAMTMDGAAFGVKSADVRIVDQVMYLSMPPLTPQGKFVEVRPGDRSSPWAGMVGRLQMMDPRDTFDALDAGLRKVRYVGEERLRGEDLERYRLTVDFRAVAKAQGMPPMATGVPHRVTYDLWLERKALMRRLELDLPGQGSLVLRTSRWGEPVREAPPRRDIVKDPGR